MVGWPNIPLPPRTPPEYAMRYLLSRRLARYLTLLNWPAWLLFQTPRVLAELNLRNSGSSNMRPAAALPLWALHQAELDPEFLRFSSASSLYLGHNRFTKGLRASRCIKIWILLGETPKNQSHHGRSKVSFFGDHDREPRRPTDHWFLRESNVGQGQLKKIGFDPLLSLNHTYAMLRANINRLIRKTWRTTKDPKGLKDHIDLYVNFHNHQIISQWKLRKERSRF